MPISREKIQENNGNDKQIDDHAKLKRHLINGCPSQLR